MDSSGSLFSVLVRNERPRLSLVKIDFLLVKGQQLDGFIHLLTGNGFDVTIEEWQLSRQPNWMQD